MISLPDYLASVAPFYNLVFALIAIYFFSKLFKVPHPKGYIRPWRLLFAALVIYIIEEILTIARNTGLLRTPRLINGFLELGIVCLVIYFLLSEHHRFTKHRWTIVKPKKKGILLKFEKMIDLAVNFFALFSPLMTLPQILQIFIRQSAADISLTTWGTYQTSALFWLLYGILHKQRPIIIANIFWLIVQGIVIIGAVIY